MATTEEEAKYDEARFLALISGLSSGAMQHLGKVVNPLTGKIERDLDAAKGTIDLLRMLREKTKGNLTEREERTLTSLISSVQLNYLDEIKAEAEKAKEKEKEPPKEKPTPAVKEEKPSEQRGAVAEQEELAAGEKSAPKPAEEAQPPEKETGKRQKAKRGKRAGGEE